MPLPIMLAHRICEAARRGAQGGRAPVPAPRREGAGHGALRGRRARAPAAGRDRARARLDAAPRRPRRRDADQARPRRARAAPDPAARPLRRAAARATTGLLLRQPDRQVRDRRPDGRHRPHRPQDHRRHLRRRGAARRRRVLRQGPDEGRPLGGLRGALRGEERRRGRASPSAASCRSPTRSASRTRCRCSSRRSARRRSPCARIEELVREHFDLRPAAILRDLDLRRPIYAKTAAYGHFGRDDQDFTWERTDKADALRAAAGLAAATATRTSRPSSAGGPRRVQDASASSRRRAAPQPRQPPRDPVGRVLIARHRACHDPRAGGWLTDLLPGSRTRSRSETVDRSGPAVLKSIRDLERVPRGHRALRGRRRPREGHGRCLPRSSASGRCSSASATWTRWSTSRSSTTARSGLGRPPPRRDPPAAAARSTTSRLDLDASYVYDRDARASSTRSASSSRSDAAASARCTSLAERKLGAAARRGA